MLGGSLDVIIPERFRRRTLVAFQRALETGATKYPGRALVTRALHRDGGKLYVEFRSALIHDSAAAVSGALAAGRDCADAPETCCVIQPANRHAHDVHIIVVRKRSAR